MKHSYKLLAATGIHKGDRQYQQDQVALLQHPRTPGCLLAIVADGMGGRSGGRKASDQVMLTAQQLFDPFAPESDDPVGLLRQICLDAHLVIKLTALSSEQEPHSTLAAFLLTPDGQCNWITSGDSRVYHFRNNQLIARTLDHSHVQAMVDRDELTEAQAQVHPLSNVLTSCLGIEHEPEMFTHSVASIAPGDCFLACSDGLWHYFTPAEMAQWVHTLEPREASERLIHIARQRAQGSGDNLSLAIVSVTKA